MSSPGAPAAGFRTRPPLTSDELTEAAVLRGTAVGTGEETVDPGAAPGVGTVVRRRFHVRDLQVLRPGLSLKEDHLTFEGFTAFPPPFAEADPLQPTLRFEGQRFFDERLSEGEFPVLLLVGGPAISPAMGFGGRRARVTGGSADGLPARPFLLAGADAGLADALEDLMGWRPGEPPMEGARRTAAAAHPLVPVDALRIAARPPVEPVAVRVLAERLLHPTAPPEAKVIALELLARILRALPVGSPEAGALVELTAAMWRLERRYAAETAYLELWRAAADQVRASAAAEQIRAMATDRTTATAREALRQGLQEELGAAGRNP